MKSRFLNYFFLIVALLLWIFGIFCLRFTGELGQNLIWQIIGYCFSFIGMIFLYFCFPLFKKIGWFFFGLTLFGRILFLHYPVSDDFYRYAWEGKMQIEGLSPYFVSPDDSSLIKYRDAIWEGINHKDYTAIYPPLSLLVFKVFAFSYPSPEFLRWFFILIDVLSVFLLWKILLYLRLRTSSIVFYALNPSTLVFFIGEIHLDVLQVHFLIWILFFYCKKRFNFLFLFLGLGIMIKYWLLLLIPIFFNSKNWYRIVFCILPLALWFVFYEPNQDLLQSLKQFSNLNFNSLFYTLVFPLAGNFTFWVGFLITIFLSICFLLIEPRIERNILWVLLLFVFVSPTVHPWYLLLPMPLLVLIPYWPLLALNLSCFIGLLPLYQRNVQENIWSEYSWSVYVIWLPFLISVVIKILQGRRNYSLKVSYPQIKKLTVIIPSYNEERMIEEQILYLRSELKNIEYNLLVVDGGSTDQTLEILKRMGVWFVSSKKGRGFQIYEGLQKATGDVCVIVHVDCKVSETIFKNIIKSMNQFPDSIGGAHQMQFKRDFTLPKWKLKIIEYLNLFRSRFLNISFGDQVQFIRTSFARRLSRKMPLMEDVFLSLEIKREGLYLSQVGKIQVSARKWNERNFSNSVWLIFWLVFKFLVLYRMKLFNPRSSYFVKKYYEK